MEKKKIAVFDSGAGGIPVLYRGRIALPKDDFVYFADTAYFPYGDKAGETVRERVLLTAEILASEGLKALVIACNTATSIAIKDLRAKYDFPVIGMEPAVKPATEQCKGKRIGVLATALTLKEKKFHDLFEKVKANGDLVIIPAPGLADLIEGGDYKTAAGTEAIHRLLDGCGHLDGLVLGCTHYLYLLPQIKAVFPEIKIFDGGEGTIRHLVDLVEPEQEGQGSLKVLSSDTTKFLPAFDEMYRDIANILHL